MIVLCGEEICLRLVSTREMGMILELFPQGGLVGFGGKVVEHGSGFEPRLEPSVNFRGRFGRLDETTGHRALRDGERDGGGNKCKVPRGGRA